MTLKSLMYSLTFGLLGCSSGAILVDGISIKDIRGDAPAFKREYKATISDKVSMTITARTFYSGSRSYRSYSGELDQDNGKWVFFDPESPADKILDRDLLPTIQRYCVQILALDNAFMKSAPSEFTDENGSVWRRAK